MQTTFCAFERLSICSRIILWLRPRSSRSMFRLVKIRRSNATKPLPVCCLKYVVFRQTSNGEMGNRETDLGIVTLVWIGYSNSVAFRWRSTLFVGAWNPLSSPRALRHYRNYRQCFTGLRSSIARPSTRSSFRGQHETQYQNQFQQSRRDMVQ